MCEHKNLRTVGDRLFCKDCKQELPLEFLLNQCKPEEPAVVAADAVAIEPAVDVIPAEDIIAAVNTEEPAEVIEEGNLEAEEILEDKIAEEVENQEEPAQEAPQSEQETGGNAPVSEEPANDKPKKKPAKTGRNQPGGMTND